MLLWCTTPRVYQEPTFSSSQLSPAPNTNTKRRPTSSRTLLAKPRPSSSQSPTSPTQTPPSAFEHPTRNRKSHRLSALLLPFSLSHSTEDRQPSPASSTSDKKRRSTRPKSALDPPITRELKSSISGPTEFKHQVHVDRNGFVVTPTDKEGGWNVDKWRSEIEQSFRPTPPSTTTSTSHYSTYSQQPRPRGPRASLSAAATTSKTSNSNPNYPSVLLSLQQQQQNPPRRPGTAPEMFTQGPGSKSSSTVAGKTSNTSLGSSSMASSQPHSIHRSLSANAYSSTSSHSTVVTYPTTTTMAYPTLVPESNHSLNRSLSGSAGYGAVRRKPVPKPLPDSILADVSPFPTLYSGEAKRLAKDQRRRGSDEDQRQLRNDKGRAVYIEEEEKTVKEMVPLLGIPVEKDQGQYVTKTTKMRWDGNMAEISTALKQV